MRLSKRIYAIVNAVSAGESVADIGTDHGYVPMLLVKNNISPYAIMSDISPDSLSKAVDTFRMCGLECTPDQFRVGDGLKGIAPGEVDDIIIAGLGAFTLIDIMSFDMEKTRSFSKFIFQPRKHSGNLRYFLYTNGFDIIAEDLSPEGKFICEIITAVPTEVTERKAPYDENDIRWKYPEALAECSYELLSKRVGWKLGSIDDEIRNLGRSKGDISGLIDKLEAEKEYLTGLLEKCSKKTS